MAVFARGREGGLRAWDEVYGPDLPNLQSGPWLGWKDHEQMQSERRIKEGGSPEEELLSLIKHKFIVDVNLSIEWR